MTAALEVGEGSASRPDRSLPPVKTRNPLYRRLGRPQGRPGQVRKISPPTGIRSPDRPARSQSLYRLSYLNYRLLNWKFVYDPKQCSKNQHCGNTNFTHGFPQFSSPNLTCVTKLHIFCAGTFCYWRWPLVGMGLCYCGWTSEML